MNQRDSKSLTIELEGIQLKKVKCTIDLIVKKKERKKKSRISLDLYMYGESIFLCSEINKSNQDFNLTDQSKF